MWEETKEYALASILSLALIIALATGCAKDVGQDNVNEIAANIQDAAEFVSVQGALALDEYNPDITEDVKGDLSEIVLIAAFYSDGLADVGDVAETVIRVLDRVNMRFEFIESENKDLIIGAIKLLSRMISRYFVSATLPEEASIYIASFASGIQKGLEELEGAE